MITSQRALLEKQVMQYYLPQNMYRFCQIGTSQPYMECAVVANDGAAYLLYFDLSMFPENKPKVYVKQMLYTKDGKPMNSASHYNHTLTPWNGWTQLCHYNDSCWTPDVTLWKVYMKCRLWIEMYRAHLRTGKTMSYYLNTQTNP
ncbi:MAG: hypothetical protein LIO90_08690 [Bacteroidales bacterium]|nr:hypothetical protein [Bacteroidales bacterium]